MSPALQQQFMHETAPVLTATVPRVIIPVGSEDADELVQDALAEACRAADSLERQSRAIPSRSIVHYTLQRMKTGRRSTGSGRTDVMSPGCQLDGRSMLASFDAPLDVWDDAGEKLSLGDVIADRRDDPASQAVRDLDWSVFMEGLTAAQRQLVWATAAGFGTKALALQNGVSPPSITQRKRTVAAKARRFWGDSALPDAAAKPQWRRTRQQS